MAIKTVSFDGGGERKLLIGLISSEKFLIGIRNAIDVDKIPSKNVRILADWCLKYYDRYGQVPGPDISELLMTSAEDGAISEEDAAIILKQLKSLDSEFEDGHFNVAHFLEGARSYLRTCRVKSLKSDLDRHLISGDIEQAEDVITSFTRHAAETSSSISIMEDRSFFIDAFTEESEPLMTLSGALGELLNEFLVRDSLLAFQAPPKSGKTFMLTELAFLGLKARRNVALFQCGDLSKNQMGRRIGIRMVGRSDLRKYCSPRYEPVMDCMSNQDDSCGEEFRTCEFGCGKPQDNEPLKEYVQRNRKYVPCTACRKHYPKSYRPAAWWRLTEQVDPMTWREIRDCQNTLNRGFKGKRIMLDCHASRQLSISRIRSILDEWEVSRNFVADIVIIDYADILADEASTMRKDKREREDEKWLALRRLSLDRHICVITATQGKNMFGDKELQDRSDFTEASSKYAHATAVMTLNRTDREEVEGIMRVAPLMVRDGECDRTKSVKVLQALHRGRPFLSSFWHLEGIKKKKQNSFKRKDLK